MYELNGELDLLVLVGGRFRRRVGFGATSPDASPIPVTNLDGETRKSVGLLGRYLIVAYALLQ